MKLVYCTFNIAIIDDVMALIKKNEIRSYQLIDQVQAKPVVGLPRLNNAVWPGFNATLFVQFEDNQKSIDFLTDLRAFNQNVRTEQELITACSLPMEDYFYE